MDFSQNACLDFSLSFTRWKHSISCQADRFRSVSVPSYMQTWPLQNLMRLLLFLSEFTKYLTFILLNSLGLEGFFGGFSSNYRNKDTAIGNCLCLLMAEKLFPPLLYIASPTKMKSSNSDHMKKLMCELVDAC